MMALLMIQYGGYMNYLNKNIKHMNIRKLYKNIIKNVNMIMMKHINESHTDNAKLDWCYNATKYFNIDKKSAEFLYKYWAVDTEIMFDTDADILLCTPFEALLMFAWCLIDDGFSKDMYIHLGYTYYKQRYHGKNNPYDISWFEETYNGKDGLDYMKDWIKSHPNQWDKIYNIVKNNIDGITYDKICECCEYLG